MTDDHHPPPSLFPQVERERLRADETATKSTLERTALDRSLSAVDQENQQLQRHCSSLELQLQQLQLQLAQRGTQAAHGYHGKVSPVRSGDEGGVSTVGVASSLID